ncbi:MAG TPA: polyketide synthase, partial [Magnetospirillum sp.]|nr:polyketide synthase [Magnetospirillum sp.]
MRFSQDMPQSKTPAPAAEPVAIIGAALRFPGADDLAEYWRLLSGGTVAITEPPPGRFDAMPSKAPHLLAGYLGDVARFDNRFFGIPTDEARHMDPQQRLLLEVAFDAMLNAGLDVAGLAGRRVGVYLGLAKNAYGEHPGNPSPFSATGGQVSCAAGRLAYHFGFRGPVLTVDTACSSALVAAHLAIRALRAGECELALIGGCNLILSPDGHAVFAELGLLAPDGRSRPFDDAAAGFGRGEGCAVAVLRRADLAAADRVLALIEGSAVNHDGFSAGLTAPNQTAQCEVLRAALADAGVGPDSVAMVETHGTGTLLGDAVEARALNDVFAPKRTGARLVMGSAKAVVGHLEHAAGMAGLLKAVLCLAHGHIPGQPDFSTPTRQLPWDRMAVQPAAQGSDWPAAGIRRAGVSAFGISGTNAHLVLRAADPMPEIDAPADGTPRLLP